MQVRREIEGMVEVEVEVEMAAEAEAHVRHGRMDEKADRLMELGCQHNTWSDQD